MAGSGVLASRGQALVVVRAFGPRLFPQSQHFGNADGEPPKRWRICSGSAPMPLKRSSVTSSTSCTRV